MEESNNDTSISTYISRIEFNNEQYVDIEKDSIIVLVGANNVGKSQTLKDIYNLSEYESNSSIILKSINVKSL